MKCHFYDNIIPRVVHGTTFKLGVPSFSEIEGNNDQRLLPTNNAEVVESTASNANGGNEQAFLTASPISEIDGNNDQRLHPPNNNAEVVETTAANANGSDKQDFLTSLPISEIEGNNGQRLPPPNNNAKVVETTTANANGGDEQAFLTAPPIIDEHEEEMRRRQHTGPELYKQGELPRPRFVMLGQQGVGKVR